MRRILDRFAEARLNTVFLWGGHLFPYIVEMPEYPEAAADVPPEQVKASREQFQWFTTECARRNIQILVHFYNIHVSPPFAKKHGILTNPSTPTPLLKDYTRYALGKFFESFPMVGLYVCPGESLKSSCQMEWFQDVIFDAAKKSGKNPVIVIRDWTLNKQFRGQMKAMYENVYSELKHNDESFTSPYPDVRHLQWEGLTKGHIVNVHGPATDLQPMRWASPLSIQEAARHWRALGFVAGVEFYGESFWQWPYTPDKAQADDPGAVQADGKKKVFRLISLDRDDPYYAAFGRYLWKVEREEAGERAYWERYMSRRHGSEKIGQLLAQWYAVSGPISPGVQNLNATKVANWWGAIQLTNQKVDQILDYNKRLDEKPYTLYGEAGRAGQRFYPRPFDAYFFACYQKEYGVPKAGECVAMYKEFEPYKNRMGVNDLEQHHCMPVRQYAEWLETGKEVTVALTPDKVVRLLHKLANESLELAQAAEHEARDPAQKRELHRFVIDSELYMLATQALIHKENAAILKARMQLTKSKTRAAEFLKEMEQSVEACQKLVDHGISFYFSANDLSSKWQRSLEEFRGDLEKQQQWVASLP